MNKTKFFCDKCGKEIDKKNAEMEWLNIDPNITGGFKGLRIIHRSKDCRYSNQECIDKNAISSSLPLEIITEADGLMRLLRFISDDSFQDKENVLEIIKRLFIPGYEKARLYLHEAIDHRVIEPGPDPKPNYCSQAQINDILKYIDSKDSTSI